jgi:hypothetical protein
VLQSQLPHTPNFFFQWLDSPLGGLGRPIFRGFTITFRHTTLGRTPLDEGPARRRDLYLTTHNIHKRQTSMPSAGFEPTIPVSERPQTQALDRTATGIGTHLILPTNINNVHMPNVKQSFRNFTKCYTKCKNRRYRLHLHTTDRQRPHGWRTLGHWLQGAESSKS